MHLPTSLVCTYLILLCTYHIIVCTQLPAMQLPFPHLCYAPTASCYAPTNRATSCYLPHLAAVCTYSGYMISSTYQPEDRHFVPASRCLSLLDARCLSLLDASIPHLPLVCVRVCLCVCARVGRCRVRAGRDSGLWVLFYRDWVNSTSSV